ncbi:MAG: DUF2628 domain-containing protein [Burkholderiales bacterium]|nr:DUF2628 domain-containing protein [Burkholderiales bacterium]
MKCPFCSEDVAENAIKCRHCGSVIDKVKFNKVNNEISDVARAAELEEVGLSDYYKTSFEKIDKNNGEFTVVFNWAAFVFSGFWYLYKGMWGKGAVMFALVLLFGGLPAPLFWIYAGIAGTYDYYLLRVKGKQMW